MATHEEEIRAKFTIDTTSTGVAKRKVEELGHAAHNSFVHAERGARGFHKVMHELIDTSGPLGRALQIAISPVAGTFAALAAGVAFVFEKLKEWNKELDKIGEENAKPIWGKEQIDKAKESVEKLEDAHRKLQQSRAPKEDEALNRIEEELDNQKKLQMAYEEIARINKDHQKAALESEKALTDQKKETLSVSKAQANLKLAQENIEKMKGAGSNEPIDPTKDKDVMLKEDYEEELSKYKAYWAKRQYAIDAEARSTRDLTAHNFLLKNAGERYAEAESAKTSADNRRNKVSAIIQKLYKEGVGPMGAPAPVIDPNTGGIAYRGFARPGEEDAFPEWDFNAARSIAYKGIPGAIGVPYHESISTAKTSTASGMQIVGQMLALMMSGVTVKGQE